VQKFSSDKSKPLTQVRKIVNTFIQTQAKETMILADGALRRIFTPDFFPDELSAIPSFVDTIKHLPLPIIGFNEQVVRATIFLKILNKLGSDVFVETGTNLGHTSLLVAAQTALPVLTCELNKHAHAHASTLLKPFGDRVHVAFGDSRSFLLQFLNSSSFQRPFFYLDAHWNLDIPLLQELALILSSSRTFVLVVDDFRVPADSGFRFDAYGTITFDLPYLMPILQPHADKICILYPSYSSELETGARRGFIMIIPRDIEPELTCMRGGKFLSESISVSGS
jgi:hypothetical protein